MTKPPERDGVVKYHVNRRVSALFWMGGLYTLYAETAELRTEWKRKLEEALALRAVIQDSNKVSEILIISTRLTAFLGLRNRAFECRHLLHTVHSWNECTCLE